jgi:hypothetical protein
MLYEKTPRNSVTEKPAKRVILELSPVAKGRGISMKRAVLYLRVSTTEQSTANQEHELREIAARMGCEVVLRC